ncbi:hypothetical protein F4703DRAFT_1355085 [Phycomyces blakesleeanus]
MNSLPFGSFHAKHFGPDQVARWQGFLFHQQINPSQQSSNSPDINYQNSNYNYYDQYYYSNNNHEHEYYNYYNNNSQQPQNEQPDPVTEQIDENDQMIEDQNKENNFEKAEEHEEHKEYEEYEEYEEYDEYDEYEQDTNTLSKETIAIFKFSEAYKKERDAINKAAEAIEDEEEEWDFDESTVAHRNGIEAPATTLILSEASSSITEHLLNSAYLESCSKGTQQSPIILWPILPLRL